MLQHVYKHIKFHKIHLFLLLFAPHDVHLKKKKLPMYVILHHVCNMLNTRFTLIYKTKTFVIRYKQYHLIFQMDICSSAIIERDIEK